MFCENGAASLMDLQLEIVELRLCLLELHLAHKSGAMTETVPQMHVKFKDAYRIAGLPKGISHGEGRREPQ